MNNNLPVVIIGNGGAAVHAIQAMREEGYDGQIRLFSNHGSTAYNPMLTTYYAAGKIEEQNCYPFGVDWEFYRRHHIDIHNDSPVVHLDAEAQTFETADGLEWGYSQCLVATGASSIVPQIPGIRSPRVLGMRTMQDASRLKAILETRPKRALVVGASMTGIKLAETFLVHGVEVCMADMQEYIFPKLAYRPCAALIESALAARGVRFRFGACLQSVEENHVGVIATFEDGTTEKADFIAICIGVRPNVDFLDPAQVELAPGVVIDDTMCSSRPNLYAAGDVAQGTNLLNGKKQIIGLWANARYQGRAAGRNMAGGKDFWPGTIPQNICHFIGMDFVSIGDVFEPGEATVTYDPETNIYRHLVRRDGQLLGANLLNDCLAAGMLKKYFAGGTQKDVSNMRLEDFFVRSC